MLEGQVAALSSGMPDPAESLGMLETLFASDLYRPDQQSFMLYPERTLPGFMRRNVIPDDAAADIPLLGDLLAAGDVSVVDRDADGTLRFHGDFSNADDLAAALDRLEGDPRWQAAVRRDRRPVLALYETVFAHASYTGRSGVMYAYEGLGCIYWHMVAKLLLAVQEIHQRAVAEDAPAAIRDGLAAMYFRVRAGIGYERSVTEYGAFPLDPYSHTPPDGGAKQPGMTGQVKEEILTRWGELGVTVEGGAVRFRPNLLERSEFLREPGQFRYVDVTGRERSVALDAGQLAFTYGQVPVVYARGRAPARIRVGFVDGTTTEFAGDRIDDALGASLHRRSGKVDFIRVEVPEDALCER
jgi:hypothetical protein